MQKVKNLLHRNKDETDNVNHHNTTAAPVAAHQNPLDRNHDGRVNAQDLHANNLNNNNLNNNTLHNQGLATGMTQTQTTTITQQTTLDGGLQNRRLSQGYGLETANLTQQTTTGAYANTAGNRLSYTRAEPTVIETIQKDVVIQERIHPVEKEEIQPIIYREREQLDVKQVTQMMHETQIQPTIVQQRELAAEIRAPIVERGAPIAENIVLATTQRDATVRTQQIHAPIVEETIRKTVIEEIQPVLERDVFVPTVVQNTQPIYEKIVEAPTVYREVREVQELGTRSVEYTQPIVNREVYVAPIVNREVYVAPVVVAPVVAAPVVPQVEHVTMSTTTSTTDSFIPAKLLQDGEVRNATNSNIAPTNTRRV